MASFDNLVNPPKFVFDRVPRPLPRCSGWRSLLRLTGWNVGGGRNWCNPAGDRDRRGDLANFAWVPGHLRAVGGLAVGGILVERERDAARTDVIIGRYQYPARSSCS